MLEVLQIVNLPELRRGVGFSILSERYVLSEYIDRLPTVLRDLEMALSDLEKFLLDFVSVFHSVNLGHALRSFIGTLRKQYKDIEAIENKPYLSPEEGQKIRYDLDLLFSDLDSHFETCAVELSDFRRKGTPVIRSAQQNQSDKYLALTTIATFFSAVTSSILQIAFQESSDSTPLTIAVYTFLFSSLIFSTAAAVQSLLAMAWQKSFIRLPENVLVFSFVNKTPLLSLIIAGAFFAIGLCLFVFSAQKSLVTSAITVIFALLHGLGLISTSIWFVYEQWKFRRQSGPIGRKLTQNSVTMTLLVWFLRIRKSYTLPSVRLDRPHLKIMRERALQQSTEEQNADGKAKEDAFASGEIIDIEVEPPTDTESLSVDLEDDIRDVGDDDNDLDGSEGASGEDPPEQTVLGMNIVEEPTSISSDDIQSDLHNLARGRGPLLPTVDMDFLNSPTAALPLSETAGLDVRRATWEQDLHRDSISYMEMYNRANPTRRRRYPPFDQT
ncbi:hypothetical protein EW145_g6679 [Phellinidium pouzarii]|uniref:Uncharacterized protein n=1 Tax=Phellinidium pouzarii TaxID=167371 RepID=A0A4S4KW31_9AGAM|nr:hypothetical protein EW145_g6679 [Phellinidium pouzarii]